MFKKTTVLTCLVLGACIGSVASALYLPVDFVYPEFIPDDPCMAARFDDTAKSGYFPWATLRWKDLWRHDRVWAGTNVDQGPLPEGIDGTGINAEIRSQPQSGVSRFWVTGMTPVGDGSIPIGHPIGAGTPGEEIANSFMTCTGTGRELVILLTGVPAGEYYLETYHNDANSEVTDVNMDEIIIEGTGVSQTSPRVDVVIQHVWTDDELVSTVSTFTTNGSGDIDVRFIPKAGGTPVLNAFILHTGLGAPISPDPGNNSLNVCPDDTLCWIPSIGYETQEVYIGTSYADVNDATTSSTEHRATLGPTDECYSLSSLGLSLGTEYWWRIDGVNEPDLWKSDIWKFTANDGNAFDPIPEVNEIAVDVNAVLMWSPGCEATEHDIYLGTDATAVANATTSSHAGIEYARLSMPTTSWDPPGALEFRTDYYWRVDAIGSSTTWKGSVWTFRTEWDVEDPNIRLWHKFDEEPPSTDVIDWSGHEFHSTVGSGVAHLLDPNNGRFEGCRIWTAYACNVTPAVFSTINSAMSISLWLKDIQNTDDNLAFEVAASSEMRVQIRTPRTIRGVQDVQWRAGSDPNDVLTWEPDVGDLGELGGWHHYVFTKDEVAGTMSIYFDARLVAQKTQGLHTNLSALLYNNGEIGGFVAGSDRLRAHVDDFRIYDRALTTDQVYNLFRGGDLASAWFPTPPDRAVDIKRDASLAWNPGDFVEFHDVYFGTDFNDVNDATTSSAVYKGRQNVDANSYTPASLLELETTYYWRIDEVNTVDPNLWKGRVWSFKVAEFLVVDDFESYDAFIDKIWYTWDNPWFTGAFIELGSRPFTPVHAGNQSMEFLYDNTQQWDFFSYWSETQRDFTSSQDWTDAGVKSLTLFMYGDPDNDANETENLSIGVEGTSRVDIDYPDMNDLKIAEWHEWNIPLSDFAAATLTAIDSIFLTFGDSANTDTPGGDGIAYFDDIRLYPPKCVPSEGPAVDLSGNCIVDFADIRIMGEEWLRTDYILAVSAPAASPIGHWELDDGSGTTASDSSANNFHGTLEGNYAWTAGYVGTGSVDFSGGRALVPDAVLLRSMSEVTVTAWVNSYESQDAARVVVKGADNKETYELEASGETQIQFVVRKDDPNASDFVRYSVTADDLVIGEWINVAGSYDQSELKIYVNGVLQGSDVIGAFTLSQDTSGLAIGNRSDSTERPFIGRIDDVRVYSTTLSESEIAYIGTQGTGYVELQSAANFYNGEAQGSRAVNLRDYAVLMNSWLEEKLWPE